MKIYTTAFFCCIAFLLSVTACRTDHSKIKMAEPHIAVVKAYKKELPTSMQFIGQTHSLYDVTIQPRISGYLLSSHYNPGMPIKKGQLLFKIDSSPMAVEVSKAKAMIASAKSELIEAQNNYNRSVPLARINAISQSSLDQATATLASAEASMHSAEASLQSANLNLSYTTIHAATEGIIGVSPASIGDYVGVGTKFNVINTISNIDSIYVYISIPTNRYLSIIGRDSMNKPLYDNTDLLTDIVMTLSDGMPYPHKGYYKFTERVVNSQTGAVVIQVLFPNPDKYIKPGQYVQVRANVGANIGAIVVPQRAVMQSQGHNSVFVVGKDNRVEFRAVTLGNTYDTEWAILDGVVEGEMVLTERLQKVRSGMKIIPILEHSAADTTSSKLRHNK